jgi:hypothetical protein
MEFVFVLGRGQYWAPVNILVSLMVLSKAGNVFNR